MEKGQEGKLKVTAQALSKLDTKDFVFHQKEVSDVLQELRTSRHGISEKAAEQRLGMYGTNELDKEEDKSLWERIKEAFEDLLVRILLIAATISFIIAITGDGHEGITAYVEPFVILMILLINAVIAIWQDSNADKAIEALKEMQAISCRVLRDGEWKTADSKYLVPGDVVRVNMGDRVPADLRIIELNSASLQVEEAPLTGESVSVQKTVKKMESSANLLPEQKNMLFSSTVINYGSANGVVVHTGMNTAIGRVQKEVSEAAQEEEDSPLKKKLDAFGERLSQIIAVICFLVWAMNFNNFFDVMHGNAIRGCIYYFKIAIALAVAAIPEGLPAVITTCLALGTRKMAANKAIVRRLVSVETLGCTTVICSDKTGTLTKNQMCAVKVMHIGTSTNELREYEVNENSYSPIGQIKHITQDQFEKMDPTQEEFENKDLTQDQFEKMEVLKDISVVCSINNKSSITYDGKEFQKYGEPTEAALKVLSEKLGILDKDFEKDFQYTVFPTAYGKYLDRKITKVATLDFTSERKSMSTLVQGYKGQEATLLLKGAPERIIEKCASYKLASGQIKNFIGDEKKVLLEKVQKAATSGLRCLAIAMINDGGKLRQPRKQIVDDMLSDLSRYNEFETGGTFLGIVCIRDPPRLEAKLAIQECKTAGIRVIMITGDSKETAVAIAKELNIIDENSDISQNSFTGTEFEQFSAEKKKEALGKEGGRVFSRVEPRHKRELVKILIDMDQVVAMTGDGVNDAPALKQAHIGVAMGITGTEVAKEASDMVLADDNFATIVKAVEEGRAIYSNMKAFIRYLISSNIGEVASIFLTAMLGVPEGFTSVQLLWVNLVTDGPPATALGFNPPDSDIMKKPPRKSDDSLLNGWVLFRYMVIGLYVGVATVGIFVYWYMFAVTGDNHTLVNWYQLRNWSECPSWPEGSFTANNFLDLDFSSNPCEYFTKGKVKACTLSLSVLVVIEMLNALNALSEDNSLVTMPPWKNPFLILAIMGSIACHMVILYIPFFNSIFGIAPLNLKEWTLVLVFSIPVILIDEVLKFIGRIRNAAELKARLAKEKKDQ